MKAGSDAEIGINPGMVLVQGALSRVAQRICVRREWRARGVRNRWDGVPTIVDGWRDEEIMKCFLHELEQTGALCNGNLLPSAAHDAIALQTTGEAMGQAMNALAEAMRAIRRQ